MINYTPRAGSAPALAIAHLQGLAPGTELTTAVLAEALDMDMTCVPSCLEYAVKHGMLAREKRDGRLYWRLGDGVPVPTPDDDDPPKQRTVKTNVVALPDLPRWPGLDNIPPPAPKPAKRGPKPQLATRPEAPARDAADLLRIALWSDGLFVIERGTERIEFTRHETQQIVGYLDRLGERIE